MYLLMCKNELCKGVSKLTIFFGFIIVPTVTCKVEKHRPNLLDGNISIISNLVLVLVGESTVTQSRIVYKP